MEESPIQIQRLSPSRGLCDPVRANLVSLSSAYLNPSLISGRPLRHPTRSRSGVHARTPSPAALTALTGGYCAAGFAAHLKAKSVTANRDAFKMFSFDEDYSPLSMPNSVRINRKIESITCKTSVVFTLAKIARISSHLLNQFIFRLYFNSAKYKHG